MQRFRFSLETVLELRRRKEDAAKRELARKRQELNQAKRELTDLAGELTDMQEAQKKQRVKGCDVFSMRHAVAYRHKLKKDMLVKGQQIQALQNEAEVKRRDLVKATQQVRALELLRERRFAQWRLEYRREEQGFIDDVSGQAYIRRKKAVAGRD